jgi:hypothetical protein
VPEVSDREVSALGSVRIYGSPATFPILGIDLIWQGGSYRVQGACKNEKRGVEEETAHVYPGKPGAPGSTILETR